MSRTETIRSEVRRMRRATPFRPFALTMKNGDRIVIEYPENIGFDPLAAETARGPLEFCVIAGATRYVGAFEAVTSVALVDSGVVPV